MGSTFIKNDKYLIKTPHGWDDFEGITVSYHTEAFDIEFDDNSNIKATEGHKFFNNDGSLIRTEDLTVGHHLSGKSISNITPINHDNYYKPYYDIFNVDNDDHSYIANDINVSNSDELAFAKKRVAREMWSSIFPTLSCLHPDTYVLGQYGYMKIKHYFSGQEVPGEYFEFIGERIYGGSGKFEPLSHGYVSPSSHTIKIKTLTGYNIEVTPDHPLCIDHIGNMIPAKHIKYNHALRCDLNMQMFGMSRYTGHILDCNGDFPEYVMLYDKVSTIEFIKNHIHQELPIGGQHQIKLQLANLGIISTIGNEGIKIHRHSVDVYSHVFGYILDDSFITDINLDICDFYYYDPVDVIGEGHLDVTYDFTVPESHAFLQNGIMGSNTGGKCIITSTPSDDETLFAEIWRGATKTIDENGEDTDIGINGFKAYKAKWDEHPERDESYKKLQIAQYGEEKFRREHELEFISMEETLLDPVVLSTYEAIDPISKSGQIRWYKPLERDKMYFIGYDPSLGTGRDNAAIVIFEFPTLIQVGEWIHNKSDVPTQIGVLKKILDMFKNEGFDEDNVFWSLENNSIGEAPLVLIKNEVGVDEFFGTFMKERKKRNNVRVRGGFFTDHTAKMSACSRFKVWFEQDKMKVMSKPLLAELKGFVRSGRTYKARSGDTDDIVMATLLVVRMVEIVMKDEEDYLEELGVTASNLLDDDDEDSDGWRQPMPIL